MFRPMLATQLESTATLRYPILASAKLDGVRALIIDEGNGPVVMSRNGKAIPNQHVQKLFARPELVGLDGELIVGEPTAPDAYRKTVSGVMSSDGEPAVTYHVFDCVLDRDAPFSARLALTKMKIKGADSIKLVQHYQVKTEEELLRYEEVCLGKGFEGAMVRDPTGPYKLGRSTVREGWLLKLKRFCDSEAIILGAEQLQHNTNEARLNALGHTERSSHKAGKVGGGVLGTILVEDIKTHVQFNIGAGFDAKEREALWAMHLEGKLIKKIGKYKFFPTGNKDKPRFPVWCGFRDLRDIS